jgi:hypothetical protein
LNELFISIEAKSNGNVFGVSLAQCVIDDDFRFQDETNPTSPPILASASAPFRKDSIDMVGMSTSDQRTSPSGSVSSTNDSGYSISPASPSSLQVKTFFSQDNFPKKSSSSNLDIRFGL